MVDADQDSLLRDVSAVCGHVNTLHAQLVRITQTMLSEALWAHHGCRSAAHWLMWQTGVSSSVAKTLIAVAERGAVRPVLMAAFDAGELSLDQIAIAVKAPAYTDRELCGLAKMLTVGQLSSVVREYTFEPDPTEPTADPKSEPEAPRTTASLWLDDDGLGHLKATLSHDDYRVVEAAMREARDALFHDPDTDARVTWGDALVEIANRSLDGVTDAARRERFRVCVYVRGANPDDPDAEPSVVFADHWRVPDVLQDLMWCDRTVTPIYTVDGFPVSVGRAQHIVPDRTRRLVEHRDNGCRVPGCDQRRWVQVHHIIHWAPPHHGPTDTWNLICLCPSHHRLHHQGKLGIVGNADLPVGTPGAVTFTDERGRSMKPGANPIAPGGLPPKPTGTWQHPLGERLDRWAVHFNPPRTAAAERN